ncbi:MAG: LysR family transcriptional regulator [Candidatus Omnitrophica bacterium]|nr:LysR family transcriptional regulator [Candidatus Omnitrophota bacterium]
MIRSLRLFCDLVETRSFTTTGRRHYMTQSAVSQHLKALEAKLGHRLIERDRRHLAVTAHGRLVYDAAQEILWRYQQLERALAKPAKEVSGALRIAASLTVGLYVLPPYLTDFFRQYPRVDLRVTYLEVPEVYDAVLTRHADVGLVAFPEPHPQLIIQQFVRDRLVVIVPPTHPWAKLKRISLKRLNGQPFIAMQRGSLMRRAVDRIFERAQVDVGILHEFDNIELIKRAVEVRSGLAIVPLKTITTEIQAGTLKPLDVVEGPLQHPIGILTVRHHERSPATQKLITSLLAPEPVPEGMAAEA